MTRFEHRCGGLFSLVAAGGLGSQCAFVAAQQQAQPIPSETPTQVKTYVVDFSDSAGGGAPAGRFNNLAFRFNLSRPNQKLAVKMGERRADVVATYDYADCSRGQEPLLEMPLRNLARGDTAWLDYIDVETNPPSQRDLTWSGGVCIGYRKPSGNWYWNIASVPLIYDRQADRYRARIFVKEPDIDAIKLVFDHSVPLQAIRTVKITTYPAGSREGR
jgi:hypothetical protein